MTKILFVMTGADHWTLADGTRHPTGFWAEEAVAPYEVFKEAGDEVVVATPGGVVPTVDRGSLAPEANGGRERRADRGRAGAFDELHRPIALEDVDSPYEAVFYPGGHGPMEDLAVNADSGGLLIADARRRAGRSAWSATLPPPCWRPRPDGGNAFTGYRLTGFTNAEETAAGFADRAKWLLQDRLVEIGADFEEGEPFAPYVVVDRNLVTGQNPASSTPLAKELLKRLT